MDKIRIKVKQTKALLLKREAYPLNVEKLVHFLF